jgi:hypothetical protein
MSYLKKKDKNIKMVHLTKIGKRLDNLKSYIQSEAKQDEWVLAQVLPLFIKCIHSQTSDQEELEIVNVLEQLIDSYEYRYNEIFETKEYCPHCLAEYIMERVNKLEEAEYRGRKVSLGKPFLTPGGPKKRSVYVKNAKGNVVRVNFGDPNMRIKKSIPARRKSYRARHHCDNPGPKDRANYWSCKFW